MATPQQRQLETEAVKSLRWGTEELAKHVGGNYYGKLTFHIEGGAIKRIEENKSIKPPYELSIRGGNEGG